MSIYDSIYLGPTVRVDPEFGFESVTLAIHFKKPGADWERAWDPNGGSANPTVPLRFWEEMQVAAEDDLCDVLPPNAEYGVPRVIE